MRQSQPDIDCLRKRPAREHDIGCQQQNSRPRKKARNDHRTVDFRAVYAAEHKHTIVEHPKGSSKWYILRCDQHGIHFGANPLQGAMKHLNGKGHDHQRKSYDVAIQMLGILVLNCDAEKAKSNNAAFDRACAGGYQPFRGKNLSTFGPDQLGQLKTGEEPVRVPDEASHNPPTNAPRAFEGITEPTVGKPYRLRYRHAYYAVLLLPTGSFESVGMVGSITETVLAARIPTCYLSNKQEKKIHGWADDYKDGGSLIHERKFPVMYFDGLRVPLGGEFGIPKGNLFSWVPAGNLRSFNFDDPECRTVYGFEAAQAFCQWMKNKAGAGSYGSHGLLLK